MSRQFKAHYEAPSIGLKGNFKEKLCLARFPGTIAYYQDGFHCCEDRRE